MTEWVSSEIELDVVQRRKTSRYVQQAEVLKATDSVEGVGGRRGVKKQKTSGM